MGFTSKQCSLQLLGTFTNNYKEMASNQFKLNMTFEIVFSCKTLCNNLYVNVNDLKASTYDKKVNQ